MKEKYTKFWHAMWDDFPEGEGRRETLGKYEYIIEEGLAKDLCFYNYSCDKDYSLDTIKAFFEENPQDKAGIDELVMDFVDWITVYKDKKSDEYDKFGRDFAVFYNELTQTQEGLPKYSDLTAEQIMAVGELYRGATDQLDLSVFGLED